MQSIAVTADLGGEEHSFALPIGQLRELHDSVAVGPLRLYQMLSPLAVELARNPEEAQAIWAANPHAGNWPPQAMREILRLGLIGAGMESAKASILIKRNVDGQPLLAHLPLAFAILGKALVPDPKAEDQPDDKPAAKKKTTRRKTSTSARSTPTASK